MRYSRALLVAAALLVAVSLNPAPAGAAAPDVSVRPLPLPVGAPPKIPYVTGAAPTYTIHDGSASVTIRTDANETPYVVGKAAGGYVVRLTPDDRGDDRIVRVETGKTQRTLVPSLGYYDHSLLSSDGRRLLVSMFTSAAWVKVVDPSTGSVVARHAFAVRTGPVPLDSAGTRVVVGGWTPARTMVWDWHTGKITTTAARSAYAADLSTDRLATYTDQPSRSDACSVVSTITHPGRTVWRSCTETVSSFSPDGARLLTTPMRYNNANSVVRRRSVHGTLLNAYHNPNGVYPHAWEDSVQVLLESYPNNNGAGWLVRCRAATCERSTSTW